MNANKKRKFQTGGATATTTRDSSPQRVKPVGLNPQRKIEQAERQDSREAEMLKARALNDANRKAREDAVMAYKTRTEDQPKRPPDIGTTDPRGKTNTSQGKANSNLEARKNLQGTHGPNDGLAGTKQGGAANSAFTTDSKPNPLISQTPVAVDRPSMAAQAAAQNAAAQNPAFKNGGSVKKKMPSKPVSKYTSGGSVSGASKRGDGIATKGKTRGKMC